MNELSITITFFAFTAIEGLLFALVLHRCLMRGWHQKYKIPIMAVLATALILTSGFLDLPFPIKSLLVFVLLIIVSSYLYKVPAHITAFITVAVFYFNLMADLFVSNIFSGIYGCSVLELQTVVPSSGLTITTIVHLVQIAFAVSVIHYYEHIIIKNPRKYWVLLDAILLLSYTVAALFVVANPLLQTAYSPFHIAGAVLAFAVVNGMAIAIFTQMSKHYVREQQVALNKAATDKIMADIRHLHKTQEEFRKIRHEWGNHLAALGLYLRHNNVKDALEHLSSVGLSIPQNELKNYTGNEDIDYVLNAKTRLAETQDIRVELALSPIGDVSIPAGDMISVITNLMDNALEAVEVLDAETRQIHVECRQVRDYIFVVVENPFGHTLQRRGGKLVSSKPGSATHGYGLGIVEGLCKKHSGTLSLSYEGGIFTAKAALHT